jgi:hypothetical protein
VPSFWDALALTARTYVTGTAIAIAAGTPIGLVMGRSQIADGLLLPWVNTFTGAPAAGDGAGRVSGLHRAQDRILRIFASLRFPFPHGLASLLSGARSPGTTTPGYRCQTDLPISEWQLPEG